MTKYILARLAGIIPTTLLLLFTVVVLVRLLPGSAIDALEAQAAVAGTSGISGEARAALEQRLGLDDPLPLQYLEYTWNAAQLDFGRSVLRGEPVTNMIERTLPPTLVLGVMALAWATVAGMIIGLFSAVTRGTVADYVMRSISILGLSIPNFALATFVIVLPTIWWKWSPPVTYTSFDGSNLWTYVSQFFVPALVLGLATSAVVMRLTRTQLLEVLGHDYVRTARAKGLPERTAVLRHALPNALIPVVSTLGLEVATLISGAVLIEAIFGLPGMGRMLLTAISERDYPVIQGIAVVSGMFVIFANLLVDISYGWLNPRVRVGS